MQMFTTLLILITWSLKINCSCNKNGKWPKAYTYSKVAAEDIIQKLNVHTLTRFLSLGILRFHKLALRRSYTAFISFREHCTQFQAALDTLNIPSFSHTGQFWQPWYHVYGVSSHYWVLLLSVAIWIHL